MTQISDFTKVLYIYKNKNIKKKPIEKIGHIVAYNPKNYDWNYDIIIKDSKFDKKCENIIYNK